MPGNFTRRESDCDSSTRSTPCTSILNDLNDSNRFRDYFPRDGQNRTDSPESESTYLKKILQTSLSKTETIEVERLCRSDRLRQEVPYTHTRPLPLSSPTKTKKQNTPTLERSDLIGLIALQELDFAFELWNDHRKQEADMARLGTVHPHPAHRPPHLYPAQAVEYGLSLVERERRRGEEERTVLLARIDALTEELEDARRQLQDKASARKRTH